MTNTSEQVATTPNHRTLKNDVERITNNPQLRGTAAGVVLASIAFTGGILFDRAIDRDVIDTVYVGQEGTMIDTVEYAADILAEQNDIDINSIGNIIYAAQDADRDFNDVDISTSYPDYPTVEVKLVKNGFDKIFVEASGPFDKPHGFGFNDR